MTLVTDDPNYWPLINSYRIGSYFAIAACVGVTYDWALTLGQEVDLVWRQRWSLMTVLYLSVRYLGVLFIILDILASIPAVSLTDAGCRIVYIMWGCVNIVVFPMLCVIMIARLHAMYQRSRRILIFLVVVCLAVNIFDGVAAVMSMWNISMEELVVFGTHMCVASGPHEVAVLDGIIWILSPIWEVLVLCLAVWIAVKHFRELRQHSAGGVIRDWFAVLIKSHVLYFASYVAGSCFKLVCYWSPTISANPFSLATQLFLGVLQILTVVQSFVLGPRLILSIREYNAKLVVDSDAATAMTSIAFQERVHVSTGSGV